MKFIYIKSIRLITFFMIILGMSSCEDFLKEEPRSNISPDTFYSTEGEANSAILGIYEVLDNNGMHGTKGVWVVGDHAADLTAGGEGMVSKNDNQGTYFIDPGNNVILDYYTLHYNMIMRANTAIDKLSESDIDPEKVNKFVGEAKFLRALAYFNLVRMFGPVVLVDKDPVKLESLAIPRSSESEVYALIEEDLKEAEINLPDAKDMERATKWAAKALLAKVYLTSGKPTEAESRTTEIMNASTGFQLHGAYNELFRAENNTLTDEILFAVSYGPAITNGIVNFLTPAQISAYGATRAEDTLFNAASYETDDLRRDMTIYSDSVFYNGDWVELNDGNVYFMKFAEEHIVDGVPEGQGGTFNYPLLRYADVLLMHAEAINEANNGPNSGAYTALNLVRARAGLGELSGLNYDQFKAAILNERKVEFVLEGHRWFDLKRNGKLAEVLSFYGEWKPTYEMFPIPESAFTPNDKLTQNYGY